MYFETMRARLIDVIRARLSNGELTERRLARMTGISQPHIHNVVKGARILTPEKADLLLRVLGLSLGDLIDGGGPSGRGSLLRLAEAIGREADCACYRPVTSR